MRKLFNLLAGQFVDVRDAANLSFMFEMFMSLPEGRGDYGCVPLIQKHMRGMIRRNTSQRANIKDLSIEGGCRTRYNDKRYLLE
jgi:hypothetical protein